MAKQKIASIGDYSEWLEALSMRYRRSQIKAAVAVNTEMLKFYFSLGRDIVLIGNDQPWGSGFLKRLSHDLKARMPEAKGFSITNLNYIRYFFQLYAGKPILHQFGGELGKYKATSNPNIVTVEFSQEVTSGREPILHQVGEKTYLLNFEEILPNISQMIFSIPWRHHIAIIDKFRTNPNAALFYVNETVKNNWSRSVLLNFLDTNLHERQGKALTNFSMALPSAESDLAQELTKDPYCFDFIALTPRYHEKELKDAMMAHIEKFLLELGTGFMLVGREYRVEIGSREKFIDLLFFHMNLNRYVVVEIKTTEFEAEHLGQLGLYVSAVNHLLKKPTHEPTIGLLVCKTKDNTMVKWTLEATQQPIGVSEYRIGEILPTEIASDLPTVEQIESAVGG
ncbi:MAG: DUF1016 family protein [Victivallales bacterium]|nr:DUF1016 family protein [Victivallales bacterium]MBQ6472236.1 DUF1016 family protein [Victivallales bacterium]